MLTLAWAFYSLLYLVFHGLFKIIPFKAQMRGLFSLKPDTSLPTLPSEKSMCGIETSIANVGLIQNYNSNSKISQERNI